MTENTNNIPTPYFSVGEEVILESSTFPECNGEYTIVDMVYKGAICPNTGDYIKVWLYDLGFVHEFKHPWWQQGALRKKYPPSEISFSEMLESFNKENVEAI